MDKHIIRKIFIFCREPRSETLKLPNTVNNNCIEFLGVNANLKNTANFLSDICQYLELKSKGGEVRLSPTGSGTKVIITSSPPLRSGCLIFEKT